MLRLIEEKGFAFVFNPEECLCCDASCCRGASGNIWVTAEEIKNICSFLKCNFIDASHLFFQRRANRFSIREKCIKNEYHCIFLDAVETSCRIYPVRPQQCRTFPFWEHFKTEKEALFRECPGVTLKKK